MADPKVGQEQKSSFDIYKLYQEIDQLDESQDNLYIKIPIYSYGIYDSCYQMQIAHNTLEKVGNENVQMMAYVKLFNGKGVEVSCEDHVKNLRMILEASKRITRAANAAMLESLGLKSSPTYQDIETALKSMSEEDKQLYTTANILDAVLVAYIKGIEDSKTLPFKAIENNIKYLINSTQRLPSMPDSWFSNGKIDSTKVLCGMEDVLFTLGAETKDLMPDAQKTYKPKKLNTILRQRKLKVDKKQGGTRI